MGRAYRAPSPQAAARPPRWWSPINAECPEWDRQMREPSSLPSHRTHCGKMVGGLSELHPVAYFFPNKTATDNRHQSFQKPDHGSFAEFHELNAQVRENTLSMMRQPADRWTRTKKSVYWVPRHFRASIRAIAAFPECSIPTIRASSPPAGPPFSTTEQNSSIVHSTGLRRIRQIYARSRQTRAAAAHLSVVTASTSRWSVAAIGSSVAKLSASWSGLMRVVLSHLRDCERARRREITYRADDAMKAVRFQRLLSAHRRR